MDKSSGCGLSCSELLILWNINSCLDVHQWFDNEWNYDSRPPRLNPPWTRRRDATKFDQNKQMFLSTLPRNGFYPQKQSSLRCLADRKRCLLMNAKWRPHVLNARRTLVKSRLSALLVCKQDKVAS